MRVEEIMKSAQACAESDTARECARTMKQENIGFVPVCSAAGEPIGTVTDRDLALRVVAEGRPTDVKISEVMTRGVVACHVGDELSEAERLMRDHRKSRIMVCDQSGKLQGVISLSDIADIETESTTAQTLRDVSSREVQQPHAS